MRFCHFQFCLVRLWVVCSDKDKVFSVWQAEKRENHKKSGTKSKRLSAQLCFPIAEQKQSIILAPPHASAFQLLLQGEHDGDSRGGVGVEAIAH